jgi:hypothetical protein
MQRELDKYGRQSCRDIYLKEHVLNVEKGGLVSGAGILSTPVPEYVILFLDCPFILSAPFPSTLHPV